MIVPNRYQIEVRWKRSSTLPNTRRMPVSSAAFCYAFVLEAFTSNGLNGLYSYAFIHSVCVCALYIYTYIGQYKSYTNDMETVQAQCKSIASCVADRHCQVLKRPAARK